MKSRITITALVLLTLSLATVSGANRDLALSKMSPDLAAKVVQGDQRVAVVAFLNSVENFAAKAALFEHSARSSREHHLLISQLQNRSRHNLKINALLDSLFDAGQVGSRQDFWITNAVALEISAVALERLAAENDITLIVEDAPLELVAPVATGEAESGLAGSDLSMAQIGVRDMWNLGYTGHGRLVCGFDTGVEGTHPALAANWNGSDTIPANQAWFDPYGSVTPVDLNGHGTHTMGLMVGRDGVDTIGVAFNARWMAAGVIDRGQTLNKTVSDILAAFQWAADPDGNSATVDDLPDVICNSWGIPKGLFAPCNETFYEAIDNLEALGVVVIFACGNEGPNPGTIRNPADRATSPTNSFSVGAVDQTRADLMIANFSSRGPANCDTTKIKPEIVAPGVSLRSSYKSGTYRLMSGTSMAAPIVAGCVALMREYNPDATVSQIKNALIQAATDLGLAGKDNEYGFGFLNVRRAIDFLPTPQKPRIRLEAVALESPDAILAVGATTPLQLTVSSLSLPVTNLTGVIRSSNQHVYLLTSTAAFGNLPSETLGDNTGSPYQVKIDHFAEPGEAAQFTIDFYSQQFGYLNSVDFTLTFAQPVIAAADVIATSRLNAEVTNYGVSRRLYDQAAGLDLLSHLGFVLVTGDGQILDAMPSGLDFTAADSLRRDDDSESTTIQSKYSAGEYAVIQSTRAFTQSTVNNFLVYEFDLSSLAGDAQASFAGLSLDFDLAGGESLVRTGDDLIFRSAGLDRFVGVRALPPGNLTIAPLAGADYKSGNLSDIDRAELLANPSDLPDIVSDWAALYGLTFAEPETRFGFVVACGNSLEEISVALQAGQQRYLQTTDVDDNGSTLPESFVLNQNYPNPFNAATRIEFYLPKAGRYSLEIINALGQSVRHYDVEHSPAGAQNLIWDGKDAGGDDVATGIYFYRLNFDGNSQTRKMVLLK